MNHEQIGIVIVTVIALIPIVTVIWKAFTVLHKPMEEIARIRDDIRHLEELRTLADNGLLERINHLTNRLHTTQQEHSVRIEDLENFLSKTTEFNKRWKG